MVMAFSSLARIFGECSTIHFPPALFLLLLLPLLFPLPLLLLLLLRRRLLLPLLLLLLSEVEISSRTLIPLFMPGSLHSGSASRDDCERVSPGEIIMQSTPILKTEAVN